MPRRLPAEYEDCGSPPTRYVRSLSKLFLRLDFTAFGGPAAHLAMMEDEVVRRRKWMTSQEFLDLVAVTNLISSLCGKT